VSKHPKIKPGAQDSTHVKMCVFGDPGVGKTRLIAQSSGKVLVIHPPTDHRDSVLKADKARIETWKIEDWDDMNECIDFLRQEGGQYDWVWVDSMSLLQDHLLDDLWDTAVREKPARARYGLDKQEYGINFFRLGGWMRHVIGPDLFNFGFTAHTAQLLPSQDEEESMKLMPWIQGKNMSPKFCGYMNVVAFMEVATIGGKRKRVLRLDSTERYYAKDQFDMTKDGRIIDPTMTKVEGLITASRGPAGATINKGRPGRTRRPVRKGSK
jgi:phage nucleotide-binding protein